MTVGSEFADDLRHELLAEMADNFFARRRRLDERLEAFAVLRQRVERRGAQALALWRALRRLLLEDAATDAFLGGLGFAVADLVARDASAPLPWRPRRLLALTAAGRYRATVRALYARLREELEAYNEGGYRPDPRDRRRMGRIPGYGQLVDTLAALNAEIAAVNACQCPSDMLRFSKSLDPVRLERESACGALAPGQGCGLDKELAYAPIDPDSLTAPRLPVPPPLETVRDRLDTLARNLYAAAPQAAQAAQAALEALSRRDDPADDAG